MPHPSAVLSLSLFFFFDEKTAAFLFMYLYFGPFGRSVQEDIRRTPRNVPDGEEKAGEL